MIEYKISFQNPLSHIIDVEAIISDVEGEFLLISLPSWRPGRYELANYAKNILRFEAKTTDDKPLISYKILKDQWKILTDNKTIIKVSYNYYAFQMDAGASWLDEFQLYINPVNCLVYNKDKVFEKCTLILDIPADYRVACGLKEISPAKFIAKDYYELVDCPLIASASLKCFDYLIDNVEFHIWFQGELIMDEARLVKDFQAFSQYQKDMMGEFPEKDYHFIFQILPYSFRHGVEHRNSTVITIGPDTLLSNQLYNDFLRISSHELFHAWNVLKIRPKELLPYDFSKENYFKTGYIAEGITTYYGDTLLARAGVYSVKQYLKEFNDLLQKHFDNLGNFNMSLADSSFDLWLDGYVQGVPGRKVSIYVKGAVFAFLLDIKIRKTTQNQSSLDDIMRKLWKDFGKKGKGYSNTDFEEIASHIGGTEIQSLIHKCVYQCTDLITEIEQALDYLGLQLLKKKNSNILEAHYGVKCLHLNGKFLVDQIANESPSIKYLSRNDEIIAINGLRYDSFFTNDEDTLNLSIMRNSRIMNLTIQKDSKPFWTIYSIDLKEKVSSEEKKNFNLWLNIKV